MYKKIKPYATSSTVKLHVKLYALPLFILVVTATSACNVQSTTARHETPAAVAAKHQQVVVSPSDAGLTIIDYVQLLDRQHWLIADSDRVWRTENGGQTWTLSYSVTSDTVRGQHVRGLCFIDDKTGFLIINQQVLRTDNAGISWDEVGQLNFDAESCYFTDELHGWAAGRTWQGDFIVEPKAPQYVGAIFQTKDGGRTWQQQQTALPQGHFEDGVRWYLSDLFFSDQRTGWAVGFGVIFWTIDGGDSWHLADAVKGQYKHVQFLDRQFGWVTEREGKEVSITNDGGKHWKSLKGPPAYGSLATNAVFLTPQHGFATLVRLYETRDAGRSWEWRSGSNKTGEGYDYLGRARDGTLVALGLNNGSVRSLVSTDNGATWQPSK